MAAIKGRRRIHDSRASAQQSRDTRSLPKTLSVAVATFLCAPMPPAITIIVMSGRDDLLGHGLDALLPSAICAALVVGVAVSVFVPPRAERGGSPALLAVILAHLVLPILALGFHYGLLTLILFSPLIFLFMAPPLLLLRAFERPRKTEPSPS